MKLDAILRAHSSIRVERPPSLWEIEANEDTLLRLLAEMITFVLRQGRDAAGLTLNAANVVVVDEDQDSPANERTASRVPLGEYVAITLRGSAVGTPDLAWRPGTPAPLDQVGGLTRAAARCGAVYLYTRSLGDQGSITVFFARRAQLDAGGGV